jgi:hypothetical protein
MNNPKFNPNIENLHEGQVYIKNAYDKEAYELFEKPYGALNPNEKEQAKKICKNPPFSVNPYPTKSTPTQQVQPSKPTNPTTEAQKETYLLQKQVEQAETNKRIAESYQRNELKKQMQQLEIQIRTMPAGQERAEALKKLYELKTGNRITNANQ